MRGCAPCGRNIENAVQPLNSLRVQPTAHEEKGATHTIATAIAISAQPRGRSKRQNRPAIDPTAESRSAGQLAQARDELGCCDAPGFAADLAELTDFMKFHSAAASGAARALQCSGWRLHVLGGGPANGLRGSLPSSLAAKQRLRRAAQVAKRGEHPAQLRREI